MLLAALLGLLAGACGSDGVVLPGTVLNEVAAPDFRLSDQAGRAVTMSGLHGRAVLLTFMYTSCPDFCPATAEKLRQTLEALGSDAGKVSLVAVSVDPEHDDRAAVAEFSARHRMPEASWHYLTGSEAELAPVWASYGIARLAAGGTAPGAVGHTEAVYVIDMNGRERTLLRGDFNPAELARGLRNLVK